MPSTKTIIGIAVAVALVLSLVALMVTQRPKPPAKSVREIPKKKRVPPPPPPKTQPPTPAPTTAPPATTPPASSTTIVYPDYAAGFIPPMPQPIVMPTPTFILVPGANFPGVIGLRKDEVVTYIMTRYPRLVVRAVPVGSQVTYEVRKDRVTVAYDPYTNRVVNARIG